MRGTTLVFGSMVILGLLLWGCVAGLSQELGCDMAAIKKQIERRGGHLVGPAPRMTPENCSCKEEETGTCFARFIDCDDLSGEDIVPLRAVANLTKLDLRLSRVSADVLRAVTDLPFLLDLDLSSTQVTDEGLLILAAAPHLQRLRLNYTTVTVLGVENFVRSTDRRCIHLELGGRTIIAADLQKLVQMPLTGLDIQEAVTPDTNIDHWLDLLPPTVSKLNLAGTLLTDDGLAGLARINLALTRLDLSRTAVTDNGLAILWDKNSLSLNSLKKLILTDPLPSKGPSFIERKDLGKVSGQLVSNASCTIISRLKNLETLDLSGTLVESRGASTLVTRLAKLKTIGLARTAVHLSEVQWRGDCLRGINLANTSLNKTEVWDVSKEPEKGWKAKEPEKGWKAINSLRCLEELYLQDTDLTGKDLFDNLGDRTDLPHLFTAGTKVTVADSQVLFARIEDKRQLGNGGAVLSPRFDNHTRPRPGQERQGPE